MNERLGVGQQVIAQNVVFESLLEPARLHGEARVTDSRQHAAARGPLDPVDDAS